MGDRVAVMKNGRLMQCAAPQELYDDPANLFVAGFIGSPKMNLFRSTLVARRRRVGADLAFGAGTHLIDRRGRCRTPARPRRPAGGPITVGVRPEAFRSSTRTGHTIDVDGRTWSRCSARRRSCYFVAPVESAADADVRDAPSPRTRRRASSPARARRVMCARLVPPVRIREGDHAPARRSTPSYTSSTCSSVRRPAQTPSRSDAGDGRPTGSAGGATPSSTRSTCAASRTATATGSATSPGLRGAPRLPRRRWASTRSGSAPWYPSPMADGGYDVADYRAIDPLFGTLDDARGLIADAHARGLRVILDIVAQPHAPTDHAWFRAALAAAPGSPERDRYIFRDGRGAGRRRAAQRLAERVRRAGVDARDGGRRRARPVVPAPVRPRAARPQLGQRRGGAGRSTTITPVLVRPGPGRAPHRRGLGLRQGPGAAATSASGPTAGSRPPRWCGRARSGTWTACTTIFRSLAGDRRRVRRRRASSWARSSSSGADRLARYVRPGRAPQAFNFDFLKAPWDAAALRATIDATLAALAPVGAPATWVLSNHDETRHVTRYGRPDTAGRPARRAAGRAGRPRRSARAARGPPCC